MRKEKFYDPIGVIKDLRSFRNLGQNYKVKLYLDSFDAIGMVQGLRFFDSEDRWIDSVEFKKPRSIVRSLIYNDYYNNFDFLHGHYIEIVNYLNGVLNRSKNKGKSNFGTLMNEFDMTAFDFEDPNILSVLMDESLSLLKLSYVADSSSWLYRARKLLLGLDNDVLDFNEINHNKIPPLLKSNTFKKYFEAFEKLRPEKSKSNIYDALSLTQLKQLVSKFKKGSEVPIFYISAKHYIEFFGKNPEFVEDFYIRIDDKKICVLQGDLFCISFILSSVSVKTKNNELWRELEYKLSDFANEYYRLILNFEKIDFEDNINTMLVDLFSLEVFEKQFEIDKHYSFVVESMSHDKLEIREHKEDIKLLLTNAIKEFNKRISNFSSIIGLISEILKLIPDWNQNLNKFYNIEMLRSSRFKLFGMEILKIDDLERKEKIGSLFEQIFDFKKLSNNEKNEVNNTIFDMFHEAFLSSSIESAEDLFILLFQFRQGDLIERLIKNNTNLVYSSRIILITTAISIMKGDSSSGKVLLDRIDKFLMSHKDNESLITRIFILFELMDQKNNGSNFFPESIGAENKHLILELKSLLQDLIVRFDIKGNPTIWSAYICNVIVFVATRIGDTDTFFKTKKFADILELVLNKYSPSFWSPNYYDTLAVYHARRIKENEFLELSTDEIILAVDNSKMFMKLAMENTVNNPFQFKHRMDALYKYLDNVDPY